MVISDMKNSIENRENKKVLKSKISGLYLVRPTRLELAFIFIYK